MCIYSIVNMKGGCGKSTISTNLVAYLAKKGLSVALIDTDSQQSSSSWVELLAINCEIFTSCDVDMVEDWLEDLEDQFNVLVVDTAGANEEMMKTVIGYSQHVLIPVGASEFDIDSSQKTIKHVVRARKRFKRDIKATAFMNKAAENTIMFRRTKAIFEDLPNIMFSSIAIPHKQRIAQITKTDKSVFTDSKCKDVAIKFKGLFEPLGA